MVEDAIKNGIYNVAKDHTLKDLKLFKRFLYRNSRKYEHYQEIIFSEICPTLKPSKQIILLPFTYEFNVFLLI